MLLGLPILLGASSLLFLSGCGAKNGLNLGGGGVSTDSQGVAITGQVHGGQNPVGGSAVHLVQVSTSGYATTPTTLYSTTTAADGTFGFPTGSWTCSGAPNDQIFLMAVGGNPGNSGGTPNPNIALMAALGSCASINSSTFVVVNEVTTVASVYSLSQFLSYTSGSIDTFPTTAVSAGTIPFIGIPTTGGAGKCNSANNWLSTGAHTCNYVGIKNAMLTVPNLVNLATGNVPALATNPDESGVAATGKVPSYTTAGIHFYNDSYVPSQRINTLANILAACVNSTGGVSGDNSNCGNLFLYTTPASTGVAPTDTIQAIWNLAQKPYLTGSNSTNFFNLASANPAFGSPASLSSAPNDWTLALGYTAGGFVNKTPSYAADTFYSAALAIDQQGNVLATNADDNGSSGPGSIVVLNNQGGPISGNATASGFGGFTTNADYPYSALAVSTSGQIYFGNLNNGTVAGINESGSNILTSFAPPANVSGSLVAGVALDPTGNIWVEGLPGSGTGVAVGEFNSSGTQLSPFFSTGTGFAGYDGIALNPLGTTWSGSTGSVFVSTGQGDQEISASSGSLIHSFSSANNFGVLNVTSAGNVFGCASSTIFEDEPAVPTFTSIDNDGCNSGSNYAPNAIDGLGHLWEPSEPLGMAIGDLIEVNPPSSTPLSPPTYGYQGIGGQGVAGDGESNSILIAPSGDIAGTAVDPSGNVWVLNSTANAPLGLASQQFIEFVGLGAPTVTPVSLAVTYNTFTQLP